MDNLMPCPKCKTNQYMKIYCSYSGFMVYCDNCYDVDMVGDPLEYCPTGYYEFGNTEKEAIDNWNNEYRD